MTAVRTQEEILEVFYEIGRALARGDGYESVVRAVVRAATHLAGADAASVLVLDPTTGNLIHRVGHRLRGSERTISFAPGEGIAGWVASHGRPANIADVRRDRRFVAKSGQRRTIRSLLCVPVTLRRKVVGVLTVTSTRTRAFGRAHARLLGRLAALVAMDLESARLEALATHDPLTGIANRRRFDEIVSQRLAEARAGKQPLAIALLDLDHFKHVNDRFGHPAGDAVLRSAVERWGQAVRGLDLLARLGGEEFGLVLPGADAQRATDVAERLRARTRAERFRAGRESIAVTVSIGVAVVRPHALASPGRLVLAADRALYRAKHGGRDCVRLVRL